LKSEGAAMLHQSRNLNPSFEQAKASDMDERQVARRAQVPIILWDEGEWPFLLRNGLTNGKRARKAGMSATNPSTPPHSHRHSTISGRPPNRLSKRHV
jgi:hypothetical protein